MDRARRIEAERLRLNRAKEHLFALQDYADNLDARKVPLAKGLKKHLAHARGRLESADNLLLSMWYEYKERMP